MNSLNMLMVGASALLASAAVSRGGIKTVAHHYDSNTFYSEIDVIDRAAPETGIAEAPATETRRETVEAEGGTYQVTIDTSETPDLTEWAHQELAPVFREWYPRLVKMLPSEGCEAPQRFSILFSKDMRGVAATAGTRIRCAADWFRRNLKGEAKGAVFHEMVHVVQQYGRARRATPNAPRPPGWLVEGIADYIRWFKFEPESHGAEITKRNLSRARYDGNYRITANFLNWVTEKYDQKIVERLNAAIRDGQYNEELWKERTGHSVQELGDEWKKGWEEKLAAQADASSAFNVSENENQIVIVGDKLEAAIQKRGYVTGVAGGSLLDKQTGFRDAGFGLDIVDWIMEPGSDEAYREQLPGDLAYQFNNAYHGKTPKRSIEGPQICTQAKALSPVVIRGKDFAAVKTQYQYHLAAPGKKTGSVWNQTIVFPAGQRYFISSDQITTVNAGEALFLRIDMPGHIKHNQGDAFSEVYLSYFGIIRAGEFLKDFAPDEKFNYRRDRDKAPRRFIRAYRMHDPKTGREGPWLAGMTLEPSVVYEAWCHQRGYVCLIEEFGGRPVKPGESFSAAFIVGYFDSVEEMETVYDQFAGHTRLQVDEQGWKLVKSAEPAP